MVIDNTMSVESAVAADYANFGNGSVWVNGAKLTMPAQAEVRSGSVVITLKPAYLKMLPNGSYPVEVRFADDGTAKTTLVVNVQAAPHVIQTIKASSGTHGNISPMGDVQVSQGDDFTFYITPDGGYIIDTLTVDGITVKATNNAYTFKNVTADHTIHVTLKEPSGLPQTGDDGNIWLWVIIGLSSILAGLCVLLWRKWRQL